MAKGGILNRRIGVNFERIFQGASIVDPVRFLVLGNKGDVTNRKEEMIGERLKFRSGNEILEIISDRDLEINIYALDGRLVKSLSVHEGSNSFNIAGGIYLINGRKVTVN